MLLIFSLSKFVKIDSFSLVSNDIFSLLIVGSFIIHKFEPISTFFDSETMVLFRQLANSFEGIEYVKHIRSPLEATFVHNHGESLYTETYQQAIDENRSIDVFRNHRFSDLKITH